MSPETEARLKAWLVVSYHRSVNARVSKAGGTPRWYVVVEDEDGDAGYAGHDCYTLDAAVASALDNAEKRRNAD